MSNFQDISCVLLAAGSSSRFGSNKLLHTLPGGKSLLASSLDLYSQVFPKITVVVNHEAPKFEELLSIIIRYDADYISSPKAELGLSQSLVAGISASSPKVGWLIALADMPYLQIETIRAIAEALQESNIVLPTSARGAGNPVGFGKNFKQQLLNLDGDKGAKAVVHANFESTIQLPVNDLGIHHDIDRPSDIRN